MDGLPAAVNLRELRDRAAVCSHESLYHHFCETLIRPSFDDPEFTNDFAIWSYRALRDDVLAERLGILDPFHMDEMERLRGALLDVLDDRLAETSRVPWAPSGMEFYFMQSFSVVFDTGIRIERPEEIRTVLQSMTRQSLYYHFVEARRRLGGNIDDFSRWLMEHGPLGLSLAEAFNLVDVQFHSLRTVREELLRRAEQILDGGTS